MKHLYVLLGFIALASCADDPAFTVVTAEGPRNISEAEAQVIESRVDNDKGVAKQDESDEPFSSGQVVVKGKTGSGDSTSGGSGGSGGTGGGSTSSSSSVTSTGTSGSTSSTTSTVAGTGTTSTTSTTSSTSTTGGTGTSRNENPDLMGGEVVVDFQQPEGGKVDILWVVDNSGSMNWAQQELSSKFESFANKLTNASLDFRLGTTSSDVCQIDWSTGNARTDALCPDDYHISSGQMVNGRMVGPLRGEFLVDSVTGQKVLTPGADFVSAFKRTAMMGTGGSDYEHGLWAAKLAIEKSKTGVNAGFLRPDAFLSVIILSDEEDDSIGFWCQDAWGKTSLKNGSRDASQCAWPYKDMFYMSPFALKKDNRGNYFTNHKYTADDFVSYLNSPTVKGAGKFSVSTITGQRRASDNKIDCATSGGSVYESGTNYIKAAQLSGGVVENICSPSWNNSLSKIGENTVQLASQVALPQGKVPFPGTLRVYVNSVQLEANKYTYQANGNLVKFVQIPAAGSDIKVTYNETL